jgi:TPR repeat protein
MYEHGTGVTQDHTRAAAFIVRACVLGYEEACS